ncbi:MAG: hypothetical protein KDB73_15225 [Planctomycetes bacterium]|nr:hypothetical protein [Planctomycetota bacterium]
MSLRVDGDILRHKPKTLDPDLKRLLVVYKPGIIEILTAPPPPPPLPWDCPRCGAVDAVRWSARGCGACRLHAEASGAR